MTTIAYKDGIVAYDSRTTVVGCILTDKTNKRVETEENVFFMSGPCGEFQTFINCHNGESIALWELDVTAIVFNKHSKNIYLSMVTEQGVDKFGVYSEPISMCRAIGSGWKWAVAAMDHGKTAKEAVEYAMTRDPGTGGIVHEFKIEKG